jgi:hypothetical protein
MSSRIFLCLWPLASLLLPAQVTTGSLQGVVKDASGAVMPAVTLELLNTSTNSKQNTQSNNSGIYIFNLVPPGTYRLLAAFPGFKTAEIQGVTVEIGRNTVIDITLQPGDVMQRVEVTAALENVDTQSSVVKANISSRMFSNLPLASRNPLRFAEMAPGVDMQFGSMTGGSQLLGADGASANVSGGRRQQNTFYLDGADNSNVRRNASLQMPNVDAISEIQVVTNSNSAEYGKQPGGYFNVITKSGTNEFHGSAFYFFRDESLNANTWVRNSSGLARGQNREKMAGGTLGGPVQRDKTFFFGSFQHYRDQNVVTSATTRYPTARMLAGDFSEYGGVLYNPDTGAPIPGNNIAAAGLIDPVASNLAKIIPSVARLGDRLVFDYDLSPRNNEFLGKVDHNLGASQRIQFSYFGTRGSTPVVGGGTRAMPGLTRGANEAAQNTMAARHTWTLSSQTILESQASLARYRLETQPGPSAVGRDISDFGARWPQPIQGGRKMLPDLEVLDGFNCPQLSTGHTDEGNFRLISTMARISGKHNLKVGVDVQRVGFRRFVDSDNSQFRFQGLFSNRGSGAFPAIPNAQFAHSFADFMMGRVNDFTANGKMDYSLPTWGFFGFVQEQWRVTRRITLNLGVRYEIWKAMMEINGRASAFVEGHKSNQFPNAPRHLAFQGDNGIPGGFIRQDRNNLAPRLGLSYDVFGDGRLALRTGYGTYYAFPAAQMRLFSTEEFPQRPVTQGFTARLYDPWATSASPLFSAPPTPYPKDTLDWIRAANFNPPYARIIGYNREFTTPLSHQWNASLERQLTGGITVSAAYVANRGRHLMRGFPFNYARFRNLPDGTPPSLDPRNILARQPFPDYSRFSIRMDSDSVADYDSIQTWANVRVGTLMARVLYTYASHFGDGGGFFSTPDEDIEGFTTTVDNPADPKGEYGRASRKHTFRAFWSYDLPLWRNAGWAGRMLGGWQLSGSLYVHSGNPLNVILGYDANFDAITSRPQDRPDLVGPIRYTSGSAQEKMRQYFDPSVFAKPVITADRTNGNLPRNALFNPGRWGSDLALMKNFRLSENHNFQFRAEAYHWLNHPLLDGAGNNMAAGDFARILTKSGNRTMQIGLRYSF